MSETTMITTTNGPHVAIFAFPFACHPACLLSMVYRLAVSAPNTLFSFFSTGQSNATIFSSCKHYVMQPNIRAFNVSDGVPEGYVLAGKHEEEIVELFMKAAPVNLRKAVEVAVAETGRSVSCVVSDALLCFTADLAEELQVPWVPCWIPGSNSLSALFYTALIREKIGLEGIEGRGEELLEFIPGMSKVRICDLPEGILFGNLQSIFSNMLLRMGRTLPQADAVVSNCFEELDLTITNDLKSKFKKFLNVGPVTLLSPPEAVPDTNGCLSWLDKQKKPASVAYVSFGTTVTLPPGELVAVAEALEASEVPFIWSLKDSLQPQLPNGFLENTKSHGMVVPWAPQLDLLKHEAVGVYVTHCGWNSMLESIVGGVPMICRPFFADNGLNGRMIGDVWEIGVNVEGGVFTKDGLMRSLNLVLWEEQGKKMRNKIRKPKEDILKAIGPDGSSMQNFKALLDIVTKS